MFLVLGEKSHEDSILVKVLVTFLLCVPGHWSINNYLFTIAEARRGRQTEGRVSVLTSYGGSTYMTLSKSNYIPKLFFLVLPTF